MKILMGINAIFGGKPSVIINTVTFGNKYASLCGRLHLNQRLNKERTSYTVRFMLFLINSIEKGHCERAFRLWKVQILYYRKKGCCISYPLEYEKYLFTTTK